MLLFVSKISDFLLCSLSPLTTYLIQVKNAGDQSLNVYGTKFSIVNENLRKPSIIN